MKKAFILISLAAILAGCAGRSHLSVADGLINYDRTPVGAILPVSDAGMKYNDEIEYVDDNMLKVTRTFTALRDVDSVRLTIDFRHDSECR